MIHLCTCTGGSTSTIRSSKRRGGTTVSCKNCGGKPAIDGKNSSSCLLTTVLELTSLINSDFTWTKVSKGCRSSSRRPRRSNSNTLNDSIDSEMPVSESEKLGVSVLGCHFSEKAEHIPIKKRRFLFKASSPPRHTANPPLEGAERPVTSPKLKSNANSMPATSETVTGMCERGSKDQKLDQKELVKDDDFSGISILAAAACSNSLGTVEFSENNVKKEEPESHTSTTLYKCDESALHNSSLQAPLESVVNKTNQEQNIQKSPARDVRFSWDLNTVMDAWEEPFVNQHEISASDAANYNMASVQEKKKDYMKDNSGNNETKELKVGKCELLPRELEIAQPGVVVKTESLHDKHIDNASVAIPVTRTLSLENPTHGIFSRWANLCGQSSGGFGSTEAVDTKLSIDCSIPPGFDHCLNLRASKENVGPPTQTVMNKHDLSLKTTTSVENGPNQSGVTSSKVDNEDMTKMELTSNMVAMEDLVKKEEPAAISSMHNAENGFGYGNSQSDNRAGGGIDKVDENSVGYDSQYEDGELRESAIIAWKGYELTEGQNENDMNKIEDGLDVDAHEINSLNGQENSSGIEKLNEVGSGKEADLTPSVVLPEKFHSSKEVLSGSEPIEMISGREKSEKQDNVRQHASQSDEWKMNVSGWDILPENQRINSNNFTKTRNFTGRKFSYREEEQKDRFDTDDVELKAEGSRFYRKESLTRIGGPSTCDVFLSRSRFQMQGCSSKDGDGLTSRPERSFGQGRYSPHNRPSGRGGGLWNRSPERGRDGGPSFHRSVLEDSGSLDNMTNEGGMDLGDAGRHNTSSTYVTRRPFRSRSPMNREANDFRARLGLRPTGDTGHDRFVSLSRGRGRGRSMRYGTRLDDEGPRGRYHGPTSDECDEFIPEYSHPFPRRRRCFSPVERRGNTNNNSYQHHQSDSRSPSRPRTRSPIGNSGFRRRSRSPGFRPDARIRRPRSPNYRDHPSEYNSGPRNNNSSPPSSRWVNYKERPVFNRSPPPGRTDGPHGERFSFYDSSRKLKQNEYYRSGPRFSDIDEGGRGRPRYVGNDSDRPSNVYRRGGFVRRYNMDGPAKRFHYDDEDGFGRGFDARDRHALELHARSNPNQKPCSDGADSRFRDFPRRQREDGGDFKRRSRDGKDSKEESEHVTDEFERRPREVKEQSTTTTSNTNVDSMMPNEVVKEGDSNKPMLGSN